MIELLKVTFEADYVVLGGGNAVRLKSLPKYVRVGDNRNAFIGGLRLWHRGQHAAAPARRRRSGQTMTAAAGTSASS